VVSEETLDHLVGVGNGTIGYWNCLNAWSGDMVADNRAVSCPAHPEV